MSDKYLQDNITVYYRNNDPINIPVNFIISRMKFEIRG